MDEEIEDLVSNNNTDELYNFSYELTAWNYILDITVLLVTIIGLISNSIIVYMIARNSRMRNKTNLILMNFALNDAFFLISNIHVLASFLELFGASHFLYYYNCLMGFIDVGFQFNAILLILILISNTLIKHKRFRVKWILIGVYTFVVINFVANTIFCYIGSLPILYILCFLLYLLTICVIAFKEFNNCYKKWYKKDPLSERTLFRLNIGRIYIGCWLFTLLCYLFAVFSRVNGIREIFFMIAMNCFMSSMYVLIYIVRADKNFQICFLNLLKCKGAGNYDVDATITFAEDSSDDSVPENNQVNINFNASNNVVGRDNQVQTQTHQNISTIRVP